MMSVAVVDFRIMGLDWEKRMFRMADRTRWILIISLFSLVAIFDFMTPPEYILAYLYIVPILISVSFFKPRIAQALLVFSILATLLNLLVPDNVITIPSVVVNRILSILAIFISAFFMVRYIRYQQRLTEQDKMLGMQQNLAQVREDFIATLTHDLKTPLLGEEQTLKYILAETAGPLTDEQREMLAVLQRGNRRQLELVQTLVSAYRNDNFGVVLQLQSINLDEAIADILIEVQAIAHSRNIRLDYACSEMPPPVQADATQIKRVLANLVHNALNYTPAGGRIQIVLTALPEAVRVEVSDTGPGIPPADLDRIFNQFYQSGENRLAVGTGLGLYLSRQIIAAHRGSLRAKNIKPHGCRFTFTLPIGPEDEKTAS